MAVDQAAAEDDGPGGIQLGQIRARVAVVDERIGRSAGDDILPNG
jgi:hypothetical protein